MQTLKRNIIPVTLYLIILIAVLLALATAANAEKAPPTPTPNPNQNHCMLLTDGICYIIYPSNCALGEPVIYGPESAGVPVECE